MERRFSTEGLTLETRADGKQVLTGYAAVFYNERDAGTQFDAGQFVERLHRSAFDKPLSEKADVRGLFNHDSNVVLGRTTSGTMRLTKDERGLKYEIDYNPNDPDHVRVDAKIRRGDVSGSSFGFTVSKDGQNWERDAATKKEIRNITSVQGLYDVGPVTYPAYEATSVAMRSSEGEWKQRKASLDGEVESEAVRVRLRILEVQQNST